MEITKKSLDKITVISRRMGDSTADAIKRCEEKLQNLEKEKEDLKNSYEKLQSSNAPKSDIEKAKRLWNSKSSMVSKAKSQLSKAKSSSGLEEKRSVTEVSHTVSPSFLPQLEESESDEEESEGKVFKIDIVRF